MKRNLIVLSLVAVMALSVQLFGALTSAVQVTLSSDHTAAVGLSTAKDNLGYTVNKTFSPGSGTTQVADLVYHAESTLTTGADATLDFYGSLTDAFGTTLNFARIKSIMIENTSGSMTLTIGNAAAPIAFFSPATATVDIPPYGVITLIAPLSGFTVTNTTADGLKLLNSAGSSTIYKIHVIGSSV